METGNNQYSEAFTEKFVIFTINETTSDVDPVTMTMLACYNNKWKEILYISM